jgi:hypothetical protein
MPDPQIDLMETIAEELGQTGVGPAAGLRIVRAIEHVAPKILAIADADQAATDTVAEAVGFLAQRAENALKAEEEAKAKRQTDAPKPAKSTAAGSPADTRTPAEREKAAANG